MDNLPKNTLLSIGNGYVLIIIPLVFISQFVLFLKESSGELISIAGLMGKLFAFGLFAYVFWLSYRTFKIYSGKFPRNQFKLLSKSEYYFAYVVMFVFFLVWILLYWEFWTLGFDGIAVFVIVVVGIFPFHILNTVYYLRDNKLVKGLSSQQDTGEQSQLN